MYEQLERTLRDAIRAGRLPAGTRLPSSRGTGQRARHLPRRRHLGVRAAGGRGVSRDPPGRAGPGRARLARPGPAAADALAGAAVRVRLHSRVSPTWPASRAIAGCARCGSPGASRALDAVGYGDPRGVGELREALADYLARVRGAVADPEHMLICTGFRQGLSLTSRWLRANGLEQVALEDPGWHAQRLIVEEAGLAVTPIPVDDEGIDVAALDDSGAEAVVVTPAHQFPTGAVLSARRRAALIEWAERGDRLIIEDDYDAELCRERVGALQGLAPDRVLYIGSASKRLTPGMRLGWMLPPSWLSWALISAKAIEDAGSEIAGQLALADFIVRGELDQPPAADAPALRASAARRCSICSRASSLTGDPRPPVAGGLHRWSPCPATSMSRR